mmetsp:Transcript_19757/g.26707  ORF Transcript_19757/g.26707 Transcript_19757/m.26707 type:complete len:98 (+) Transcript_19757:503-796(+)|eukprot:CAMPEP_0185597738 /NCGR_PEP_ID=MMETSP0434-20130131/81558_1 /TAXON_ID=626734 ORGANISM="Favella taraikaensis, Strain Fe Narragansett Bay" /NCGR_SAMPLE_ID=MMETSP0434 /ASSEMBLY_ACC=CAM_ASM_000379 /LENGTH=97 /DNA_ID=CAMNT_0028226545 /DNA_START=1082 /DNA_END=1375 /DNA_ORIENTATION=-
MAEFEALKSGDKPLVIDFTATWCPPCKRIGPVFESLVDDHPELVMKKVDVDQVGDISQACGVSSMPTFKVFKGGEESDAMIGADEEGLKDMLARAKA